MSFPRITRQIALDAALWYCIPAAFMLAYIRLHSEPSSALKPHAIVVALPLVSIFLLRVMLARLSKNAVVNRFVAALIAAALMMLLAAYYFLVLVGLHAWGGVVAWNVIPTFFAQASVLTDALRIPLAVLGVMLALGYLGLVAACWSYIKRSDWAPELVQRVSGRTLAALVIGASGFVALEAYEFSLGSWTVTAEPISLTLFPRSGAFDLEGYSVNPVTATRQDRLEDAERRAYLPASGAGRNLVVIVVDALRPDHMGIYGYGRDTTPNLLRISRVQPTRVVDGMHSSCADTICAMFSLFSSKFPRDFSFHPFTLQEVLRLNGYRVHMVLSGDHTYFHSLKGFYGPVDTFYDGTQARGYFLNDDRLVLDHVASMPDWDGVPAMFQFHLMSAHILRKSDTVPGRFQPAVRYFFQDSRDIGSGAHALETAVNFYDNGVLGADAMIDGLLGILQRKGYLKNALVVITADHGESLGEHGLFHHANSVREEVLRIPLVLTSYGYQPPASGRMRPFPTQVDIAPTILADLTLPQPATWLGRPVQDPNGAAISFFEEQSFAGLMDHRDPANVWKYWVDRRTGRDHVFNLSVDPHEERDMRDALSIQLTNDWRARTLARTSAAVAVR